MKICQIFMTMKKTFTKGNNLIIYHWKIISIASKVPKVIQKQSTNLLNNYFWKKTKKANAEKTRIKCKKKMIKIKKKKKPEDQELENNINSRRKPFRIIRI